MGLSQLELSGTYYYPLTMPRKRSQVIEDSSTLMQIETSVTGTPKMPAIKMLRLLEEERERTLSEVAILLKRPERTIRRWWRLYLEGGVDALLKVNPVGGQRPARLPDEAIAALHFRAGNSITDLKEVQKWLVEEYGVSYSLARVSTLLRGENQSLREENASASTAPPLADSSATRNRHLDTDMIRVLNSIPTTVQPIEWARSFSQLLTGLFPDVDRISVNINTHINLSPGPAKALNLRLIQHVPDDVGSRSMFTCVPYDESAPPSKQLLHDFKERGCPVHLYHPPTAFDYFTEFNDYVGSLIVWRHCDKEPTSATTLALFEQLRPFIVFALTDAAARNQCVYPSHTGFQNALSALRQENNLTTQEFRIVSLRFLGFSYKDIAEMLFITVSTVKKHLSKVHQKSKTRSQSELFARYVSVREWA
jgi:transposase